MATVRVKPGVSSAVFLPDGRTIILNADMAFDSSDEAVKAAPWAFQSDADADPVDGRKRRSSVRVEQATRGELA